VLLPEGRHLRPYADEIMGVSILTASILTALTRCKIGSATPRTDPAQIDQMVLESADHALGVPNQAAGSCRLLNAARQLAGGGRRWDIESVLSQRREDGGTGHL
jgi:hypothetical protein